MPERNRVSFPVTEDMIISPNAGQFTDSEQNPLILKSGDEVEVCFRPDIKDCVEFSCRGITVFSALPPNIVDAFNTYTLPTVTALELAERMHQSRLPLPYQAIDFVYQLLMMQTK